jgi:predicted nuclease of predicted toxin-antitoxin system
MAVCASPTGGCVGRPPRIGAAPRAGDSSAAAAEAADLVVLHYDADFDLIAAVTGQPTEWVVPAGLAD